MSKSRIRRKFECPIEECGETWQSISTCGNPRGAYVREACPKCGYDVQNDDIDFEVYAIITITVFTDKFDDDKALEDAKPVLDKIKALSLPEGTQITMDETGGY